MWMDGSTPLRLELAVHDEVEVVCECVWVCVPCVQYPTYVATRMMSARCNASEAVTVNHVCVSTLTEVFQATEEAGRPFSQYTYLPTIPHFSMIHSFIRSFVFCQEKKREK